MRLNPIMAAVVAVLIPCLPAAASGTSSVTELRATRAGNTLTVEGAATFFDASTATVAVDPAGDTTRPGIGTDVTAAKIRRDVGLDELAFSLNIADELPGVFTLPEVVHYHWHITVTHGTRKQQFLIQAMRSGQKGRVTPNSDPMFRVVGCVTQATGSVLCDGTVATVRGTMAAGVVEWHVPIAAIGALPGAIIQQGPGGVLVQPGASGYAYVSGETSTFDNVTTSPYVVGPSVVVGLRRSGTPFDDAQQTHVAVVGPDGTFTSKLPVKPPGEYLITARACQGDRAACGAAELPVTF